jgi:hypothetical protein
MATGQAGARWRGPLAAGLGAFAVLGFWWLITPFSRMPGWQIAVIPGALLGFLLPRIAGGGHRGWVVGGALVGSLLSGPLAEFARFHVDLVERMRSLQETRARSAEEISFREAISRLGGGVAPVDPKAGEIVGPAPTVENAARKPEAAADAAGKAVTVPEGDGVLKGPSTQASEPPGSRAAAPDAGDVPNGAGPDRKDAQPLELAIGDPRASWELFRPSLGRRLSAMALVSGLTFAAAVAAMLLFPPGSRSGKEV